MADIALDVQSAPTTPAAGVGVVYVDSSTKKLATKDDAGTVVAYGAAIATPVTVANGGTGDTSLTAYAVLTGGTTSTGAVQSIASVGSSGQVLTSNGAAALPTFQASAAGTTDNKIVDFRLTLTTITPVTTTDVTGATTVYCSPYTGNRITLYDGANWNVRTSAEFSLALGTLTSALPYDVFCYDNSTVPTLEFLAWTNTTTRATALVLQDGVLSKSGATTRRYMGTFLTTSTTTTEDSLLKRDFFNYYNQVRRPFIRRETTNSWSYTTATWRQANASASNQIELIIGWSEQPVSAVSTSQASNGSVAVAVAISIGVDVTNAPSTSVIGGTATLNNNYLSWGVKGEFILAVGRHVLAILEISQASGTTTWYGGGLLFANVSETGISGWIHA